jgi:sugar phosphate isomerase/epimerase
MKMKATLRALAAPVLAASALLPLAAPASAQDEPYKIYLSMSFIGNDWQAEAANMVKAMAAHKSMVDKVDLQVQVAGPNAQRQIQQINAMVQSGAQAIVIFPISPTALNQVVKNACDKAGLTISGLQAHGPLGRPEVHGEYLKMAIRVAGEIGVPVINTDEGIKASWTTPEEDFVLIRYTLQEAAFVAERRGVKIGLECHSQYSRTPDGLDKIYNLVKSPSIGINLDTGNAYLAGQDVYSWLERVAPRLVHLHAKDISDEHSKRELGKVAGTPVGCACGDGILDWKRIIGIVKEKTPRDIVFSVECGTPDQAKKSLDYLGPLV